MISQPPRRRYCWLHLLDFLQRPAGRAGPTAIAPSSARWCQRGRQRHSLPASAPVSLDSFPAPMRSATRPEARQYSLRVAETAGAEASWRFLRHSITSSAVASSEGRARRGLSKWGQGLRPARLAPSQVSAELPSKRCHAPPATLDRDG